MHIKRFLSSAMVVLLTITSINFNVMAEEFSAVPPEQGDSVASEQSVEEVPVMQQDTTELETETPEVSSTEPSIGIPSVDENAPSQEGLVDVSENEYRLGTLKKKVNDELLGECESGSIDHVFQDYRTISYASFTSDGKMLQKCEKCNETQEVKILKLRATIKNNNMTYTGEEIIPEIEVKDDFDEALPDMYKEGDDYTVTKPVIKNAGDYSITIKFNSKNLRYANATTTLKYTVKPMDLSGLTEVILVAGDKAMLASENIDDGFGLLFDKNSGKIPQPVEPEVSVTLAGEELTKANYDVEYIDNDDVTDTDNLAKAVIYFKGNYTGTVTKGFKIVKAEEDTPTVIKAGFNKEGYKYYERSKKREPILAITRVDYPKTVVLTGEGDEKKAEFAKSDVRFYLSDGSEVDIDSTDYTLEFSNNKKAGTGTCKIKINNDSYDGTKDYKFTIVDERDDTEASNYNILVVDKQASFTEAGKIHFENIYGEKSESIAIPQLSVLWLRVGDTPDMDSPYVFDYEGPYVKPFVQINAYIWDDSLEGPNKLAPAYIEASENNIEAKAVYKRADRISPEINPEISPAVVIVTVNDKLGLYNGSTSIPYRLNSTSETVEAPVSSLGLTAANVGRGTKVRLTTATKGAKIYYSTSGIPDEQSTLYVGEITLDANVISGNQARIHAIAIKRVGNNTISSSSVEFIYTMKEEYNDWGQVHEDDKAQWAQQATSVPEALWIGTASMDAKTYNGKPQTFTGLRVYYHKNLLEENVDYTLKYANNTNAALATDTKAPTIIVDGKGHYSGTFEQTFTIDKKSLDYNSGDLTWIYNGVNAGHNAYLSTGKQIAPTFKLVLADGKTNLTKGKDYTVEYKDITYTSNMSFEWGDSLTAEAGDKSATVTMMGNYSGTFGLPYKVVDASKSLNKATKISITSSAKWSAEGVNPNLFIKDNKTQARLRQGTDYDVTVQYYGNGTAYGSAESGYREMTYTDDTAISLPSVGYYEFTITGKDAYAGSVTRSVKITGTKLAISDLTTTTQQWTGTPITPSYNVKNGKDTVAENYSETVKNYTAIFSNNINIGTATLTVVGNNDCGWDDAPATKTFKIAGYTIKASDVAFAKDANNKPMDYVTYDGENPEAFEFTFSVKGKNGALLIQGIGYKAELYDTYTNANRYTELTPNAGTKQLVITGVNGQDGVVKKAVKINPIELSDGERIKAPKLGDEDEEGDDSLTVTCLKDGAKVVINLKADLNNDSTFETNLVEGTDFTVKYSNNKNVAKYTDKNAPTATLTGKGNYKGTLPIKFTINRGDISDATMIVQDISSGKFTSQGAFKPVVTFDKTLAANTDYTLGYFYNSSTTITRGGKRKTVERMARVDIGDVIPDDTYIFVRANGVKNYKGSIWAVSHAVAKEKNISSAQFTISDKEYDGSIVTLSKDDFTKSVLGKTELTLGKDFAIDESSYVNNDKTGQAKVTLVGVGEYGGSKTVSFKIKTKSMDYKLEFVPVSFEDGADTITVTGTMKTLTSKDGKFKLPAATFKLKKGGKDVTSRYVLDGYYVEQPLSKRMGIKDEIIDITDADFMDNKEMKPGETLQIYPKYEPAGIYTIIFEPANGESAQTTQEIKRGTLTALKANTYTFRGHKFTGWRIGGDTKTYVDKQKLYDEFAVDTSCTLEAQWIPIEYKITYKDVDEDKLYSDDLVYTVIDIFGGNEKVLPVPEKEGYTFKEWKCSNANAIEKVYDSKWIIKEGTMGALTCTAIWSPCTFDVAFDNNTCIPNRDLGEITPQLDSVKNVESGKNVVLPKLTATKDYSFLGWSSNPGIDNSVDYKAGTSVKLAYKQGETLRLYAVWSENSYGIKYSGVEVDTSFPTSFTATDGNLEAALTKVPSVTRDKKFKGWKLGNTLITNENKETEIAKAIAAKKSVTLTAVPETGVEFVFDSNGGSGKMNSIMVFSLQTMQMPECGFIAPKGMKFVGWCSSNTPKQTAPVLLAGSEQTWNFTGSVPKYVTYYALWEVDEGD